MQKEELNKYFSGSHITEINRSQINPASYNPRKISEEGKKALKKSIKLFGVVGGIILNKRTGFTIVGGHQKVAVLDELNKYNTKTKENDYTLRAEVIDVDEKVEKELNITLNNPKVGGEWDYDALAQIVPDIDYKDAGLDESDLSMIGLDYLFKTEEENNISNELDNLMEEVAEQHAADMEQRREERKMEKGKEQLETPEERQQKIQNIKDAKRITKEKTIAEVEQKEAYFMVTFDTLKAKSDFLEKFGYDPYERFIKGEIFERRCDVILDADDADDIE